MNETSTKTTRRRDFALCAHTEKNCFANRDGVCMALGDTNFGGRECPFYKTKEQRSFGLANSAARLESMGLEELIDYPAYKTKIEAEKKRPREKDEGER